MAEIPLDILDVLHEIAKELRKTNEILKLQLDYHLMKEAYSLPRDSIQKFWEKMEAIK